MIIVHVAAQFYEYSIYIRGYSKGTIARYRQAIQYYTKFAGIASLEEITRLSLEEMFLHGRMVKGWRPASYRSYLKSLSVFFDWCVERTYMPLNPVKGIESPKLGRRLPVILSLGDARRVLESAHNYPYPNQFIRRRNHAIMAIILYAGLRKTEVLELQYANVDFQALTIMIRSGKGNKDRVIPMCVELSTILQQYLFEREKKGITCAKFFASSQVNAGIANRTLVRIVELVKECSKIKFTLHTLRRTFATLLIEGGCDIYSLSKMMGHEDIKTTTWYLQATTTHLKTQIIKHPLNN